MVALHLKRSDYSYVCNRASTTSNADWPKSLVYSLRVAHNCSVCFLSRSVGRQHGTTRLWRCAVLDALRFVSTFNRAGCGLVSPELGLIFGLHLV